MESSGSNKDTHASPSEVFSTTDQQSESPEFIANPARKARASTQRDARIDSTRPSSTPPEAKPGRSLGSYPGEPYLLPPQVHRLPTEQVSQLTKDLWHCYLKPRMLFAEEGTNALVPSAMVTRLLDRSETQEPEGTSSDTQGSLRAR